VTDHHIEPEFLATVIAVIVGLVVFVVTVLIAGLVTLRV
jgi:hypothetical protein